MRKLKTELLCVALGTALHVGATTIVAGEDHSVAFRAADGVVITWGSNSNGRLGNGTTNSSVVPLIAKNFAGATSIAAGSNHTLIAKQDGTAWAWGYNSSGQLGTGDTTTFALPMQVQYLSDVQTVAAGCDFSLALKVDGTVWSWGSNYYGQLGYAGSNKSAPLQIPTLNNVTAIAAGCKSGYALRGDGSVWSWGYNSDGQLGNGSTTSSSVPVAVAGATGVAAVAAGNSHVVVLKQDGSVMTWGANNFCQLGRSVNQYNNCVDSSAPAAVTGLSGVRQVVATYRNTAVLKSDGTVWVFGSNEVGQLGNGSITGYNKVNIQPVMATGLTDVSELAGGQGDHFLARKISGEVFAWGHNYYGQLGKGDMDSYSTGTFAATPVPVLGLGGDGKLNLNATAGSSTTTELCRSTVSTAQGITLDVPCADLGSTRYQLKLQLDPTVPNGTFFKLTDLR